MDVEWWNLEKIFKFFSKFWKIQAKKTVSRRGDESLSREGQHFDCCGWSAIGARSCQHLKAYNFDATNGFRQTISQFYADLWKIYGDVHTCSVVSELEGAVRFAWEREPSFVSLVWVFMEKLKTSLGYVAMEFPFYGRSGERIIILRCLYPWNGSQPKIYLPRISRVHQMMSLETILGLLGKSMCILVLLSGFSILMGHMHILDSQLRKDPVCGNLSTAYHKLEEHRS